VWQDEVLGPLEARLMLARHGVVIQIASANEAVRRQLVARHAAMAQRFAAAQVVLAGWQVVTRLLHAAADRKEVSLPAAHPGVVSLGEAARAAGLVVHDNAALVTLLLQLDWRRLLPGPLCLAAGILLAALDEP